MGGVPALPRHRAWRLSLQWGSGPRLGDNKLTRPSCVRKGPAERWGFSRLRAVMSPLFKGDSLQG